MSHTNFLGIPVDGDIVKTARQDKTQRSLEEFQPILRGVLDDDRIDAVRWQQYTPYFNDGEPCEFTIYDIYVKPKGGDPAAGDSEDGFIDHWSLGYDAERQNKPELLVIKEATAELNSAVAGGEFYDVLLDAFGDHAVVTVARDGITVEFYEHD